MLTAQKVTIVDKWVAEVKGGRGSFEVSVCYGKPAASWGWFGPEKIRIEFGSLEHDKIRAEKIAAALNAAGYVPTVSGDEHG